MNLDELQSVRDRERQTDKPQQLRESFYADVGEFVEQLRTERDRVAERNDDPYAPEAMRLKDEIDAARQLVEDIHERRIGKLVKAASLEAADLSPEVDGLTTEEQDLFAALVGDIEHHRDQVLDTVEGTSTESTPSDDTGQTDASTGVSAADVMGPTGAASGDGTADASGDRGAGAGRSDAGPESGEPPQDRTDDEHADDSGSANRQPSPAEPARDGEQVVEQSPVQTDETGGDSDRHPNAAAETARPDGDGGPEVRAEARMSHDTPVEEGADGTVTARSDGSGVSDGTRAITPGGESPDPGTKTSTSADGSEQRASPAAGGVERERVLITEAVDTFVGFDGRNYDLDPGTVVTLPSTNAAPLVERGAARRL
jgi:DNA replication factor GINS